jgi:hypothetical protein
MIFAMKLPSRRGLRSFVSAGRFDVRTTLNAWTARAGVAAMMLMSSPLAALAQDDDKRPNARLEGFGDAGVSLGDAGGTSPLTWLLLAFLTACAVGVLFKNAHRTHLD